MFQRHFTVQTKRRKALFTKEPSMPLIVSTSLTIRVQCLCGILPSKGILSDKVLKRLSFKHAYLRELNLVYLTPSLRLR
jgi:hypothetical protein